MKKQKIKTIILVVIMIILIIGTGVEIGFELERKNEKILEKEEKKEESLAIIAKEIISNIPLENGPQIANGTKVKRPKDKTWDGTKMNTYSDGEGNYIPVPLGFKPITIEEQQGTKQTGFVIRNQEDQNEFVWVPVEGMNYEYKRDAFGSEGFLAYSEELPTDEKESIQRYGGYYIGRYETGIEGYQELIKTDKTFAPSTPWTGYIGGKLVVQRNKQVWNWITKNQAEQEAKKLYNQEENHVNSKLCSSYAWDTALKFMEQEESTYPQNSIGGYYNQSAPTTTGYDTTHPCNIYDMGGNVFEWTTEEFVLIDDFPCVIRGGDCQSNDAASYRSGMYEDVVDDGRIGFRIALFL